MDSVAANGRTTTSKHAINICKCSIKTTNTLNISILPPPISKFVIFLIDLIKNPRSFFISLRYVPFRQALKIPIKVAHGFKFKDLGGKIIFDTPFIHKDMLQLGYFGSTGHLEAKGAIYLFKGSTLVLKGCAFVSQGSLIRLGENSTLEFGNNFWCNNYCKFLVYTGTRLIFHPGVLVGLNVEFGTADGHSIYINSVKTNAPADVSIGEHVWIGSCATISKGVCIAPGCVIARSSLVTKSCLTPNCILGGIPAKILRTDICWEV